jgi:MEMO1 family protein
VAADRCEACGAGPMAVTMMLSRKLGADRARVLRYANSGDVSGDRSAVVGYVSAVCYRSGEGDEE